MDENASSFSYADYLNQGVGNVLATINAYGTVRTAFNNATAQPATNPPPPAPPSTPRISTMLLIVGVAWLVLK